MNRANSLNAHRLRDPESNPCLKEGDLSLKCLEKNNYNKNDCKLTFKNYNNCLSFWSKIMRERQKAQIKPFMPGEKERQRIKQERENGKNVISAPTQE